ncbi:hypothetical protein MTO96_030303 [Rhipicephalus appendiculatus]
MSTRRRAADVSNECCHNRYPINLERPRKGDHGQKCDLIGALSKTDFRSALEGGRIENAYPSLNFKGQKPHGAGEISAHSEDFAADVLGTIAGIAALIHVYYAIDVQYAPQKNTFALREHFCSLPCSSMSPQLKHIISAIQKEFETSAGSPARVVQQAILSSQARSSPKATKRCWLARYRYLKGAFT